jgi:hypothetical protein
MEHVFAIISSSCWTLRIFLTLIPTDFTKLLHGRDNIVTNKLQFVE